MWAAKIMPPRKSTGAFLEVHLVDRLRHCSLLMSGKDSNQKGSTPGPDRPYHKPSPRAAAAAHLQGKTAVKAVA
jgi:hypothetical protein